MSSLVVLEFTVRNFASALVLLAVSVPALAAPTFNVDEPSVLALMGAVAAAGLLLRRRK